MAKCQLPPDDHMYVVLALSHGFDKSERTYELKKKMGLTLCLVLLKKKGGAGIRK